MLADFLPPFLGDLLQHLRIMPAASAALKPVDATHLFTQTASAAMLSNEGLVLEDVPAFTQYTAFSMDGEEKVSHLESPTSSMPRDVTFHDKSPRAVP